MKICLVRILRWHLRGMIVALALCGQAHAQTWQAGMQLAPGSNSCFTSGAVFKFTLVGSELSILTPAGPTYRGSVAPDGNVVVQFKGADGGDVTVSGNARTRDLRLVNSKYKGCTYTLVAHDGQLNPQTGEAKTLHACAQDVPYAIQTPDAGTPPNVSAFLGAWVGEWGRAPAGGGVKVSSPLCAGVIVEKINADGTASTIYFFGTNAEFNIKNPRKIRWNGKISGAVLKLPQDWSVDAAGNSYEFTMKDASTLDGFRRPHTSGTFLKKN